MKAIVLSCDKYHPIAEHMILKYQELWPTNPFTFRVPWNNTLPNKIINRFNEKIEPIHTNVEFKKTFHDLTKDLDDDEWIFWCIDDKYPIELNEQIANQVIKFISSIKDTDIVYISFHFVRAVKRHALELKGHPNPDKRGEQIKFQDLNFLQHHRIQPWLHQFFRVKTLRKLWSFISEPEKHVAYTMDDDIWKNAHLIAGKRFVVEHNICTYGESTWKGKLTRNCHTSFKEQDLPIPSCFEPVGPKLII
jgi:hypothetical protein